MHGMPLMGHRLVFQIANGIPMKKIASFLLIIVGIIHVLPLVGVIGADKIQALYGIHVQDPNLESLMRHRAILFGLLGLFIVYAASQARLQALALICGFISAGAFVGIAWSTGRYNDSIGKVVLIDVLAIGCLIMAGILYCMAKKSKIIVEPRRTSAPINLNLSSRNVRHPQKSYMRKLIG